MQRRRYFNVVVSTLLNMMVCQIEEAFYAQLWREDHLIKCQREEMKAALQIERNKETLDVCYSLS